MGIGLEKSKAFAIRIVRLYVHLRETKREYVMSKQLLRCGTSIGANLAEAECAISRADFKTKVYIALKECAETMYWIELLMETNYLTSEQYESIYADAVEIRKILTATTKTIAMDEKEQDNLNSEL